MKIAIITGKDPMYKNDTDGANILVENISKQLSKENKIDIYTPKGYSGNNFIKEKFDFQKEEIIKNYKKNINIIKFEIPRIITTNYKNSGLNFLNRINISNAEAAYFSDNKLFKYDLVIIIHMAHSFGIVLNNLTPINKTILFPMMLGKEYKKFIKVNNAYIQIEKEVLSKLKHIQSPSKYEQKLLIEKYKINKNQTFYNHRGFNQEEFKPKIRTKINPNKTINIISANMIRPQKGQKEFIKIAKIAKKEKINLIINLIGVNQNSYNPIYNKYAKELENQIHKNKLENYFKFINPINQKELSILMNKADIAIYPSISETFGKSALESMVTGLVTIVYDDVAAYKEFITNQQDGFIIKRDANTTIKLIKKLISNSDLYEKISINGIKKNENYSWTKKVNQMILDIKKRIKKKS